MYGGVSLAIYINGIAQELLRLVRSTAKAGTDENGSRVGLLVAGVLIVFALEGTGLADLPGYGTSNKIVTWVMKAVGWLQALKAKIF
jgi:hypothetical protein